MPASVLTSILTNHFVSTIRCGSGKYKYHTLGTTCYDCPAGKYKEDEVTASSSDCINCAEGKTSGAGAGICEL